MKKNTNCSEVFFWIVIKLISDKSFSSISVYFVYAFLFFALLEKTVTEKIYKESSGEKKEEQRKKEDYLRKRTVTGKT